MKEKEMTLTRRLTRGSAGLTAGTVRERYERVYRLRIDLARAHLRARTQRAPEWLRARIEQTSRRAILRRAVQHLTSWHMDPGPPRLGIDSDRSGAWSLGLGCVPSPGRMASWGWFRYAAARRSLAGLGYPDAIGREIATQAALCESVAFVPRIDGQIPEPPAGDDSVECYGWDRQYYDSAHMTMRHRSDEDARRVRLWTAWLRGLRNDDALMGRRTRRWVAASVRAVRAKRAARGAALERAAADWLAAQPADVQAVYATGRVRATCIRYAAGTVHESLHDVGGSMTFQGVGLDTLAEQQAAHDAVYHQGQTPWYPAHLTPDELTVRRI